MGLDFANYQVFAGNTNIKEFHKSLLSQFPELMVKNGFQSITQSEEADRIIVVGPPGRWIWIYDSYAEGINPANHYLKELAIALSGYGEVVTIAMYDSAIVHFFLYQKGDKIDQFVSSPSFYFWYMKKWEPQATYEESDFYGRPEKWSEFLLNSTKPNVLKTVWQQKRADEILQQTANVMGWHPVLCQGGYIISNDGYYDFRYDEYFEFMEIEVTLSGTRTYYFAKET
jgi:hypothetical protein